MKPIISYPFKVFATGFIVLVFLSLLLFQIRSSYERSLSVRMPDDAQAIRREPSGLVPDEFEKDPNVVINSHVSAHARTREPLSLGIFDYFQARIPGGRRSNVYFYESERDCMYFDKKSGLIVHHYFDLQVMPDKRTAGKWVRVYVGPEGVLETRDKTLGRFIEPIRDRSWIYRANEPRELMLFDKKLRRFFKIDFSKGKVTKGPELVKNHRYHKPIQIGRLSKRRWLLNLNWEPPKIQKSDEGLNRAGMRAAPKPIVPTDRWRQAGPYLLVLDKSGRIDLLDKESLEFVKNFGFDTAGRLSDPETYIGSRRGSARPGDLLGYDVLPLCLTTHFYEGNPESKKEFFGEPSVPVPSPLRIERKYLGMFAASLSRDGTALALTVFDEKGKQIKREDTEAMVYIQDHAGSRPRNIPSSKAFFFQAPWASTLTIGKFSAENLHPPILSVASYFTASAFEAASGHRALFFLPNSFIAMKGRDHYENFAERFFSALWWISPSIILAILLAWRVGKNAAVIGLSEKARHCWIIGTLAFGLTAYITYRLTRPKITLVTCQNCGKMRRPDMAKCHRCGSKWHVPELTPPAWRVLDGGE